MKENDHIVSSQNKYNWDSIWPGRWLITFAFICRIGSQRISKKSIFAPVAVEASGVIDALQAFSRQAIAIANCVGIDVVIALA